MFVIPSVSRQLPDGQLYVASKFSGKPHQLKLFRFLGRVRVG